MQVEILDDVIQVRADFGEGKVTPRIYKHNGKRSLIKAINARWRESDGATPVLCFSVQRDDDTTCYLRFDTGQMQWRLAQIILP